MKTRTVDQPSGSLDDLELELRRLPGVLAAGFEVRDDLLHVQLHVAAVADRDDLPIPVSASRIAARHSDRPVSIEVVRSQSVKASGPRPRALVATPAVVPSSPNDRHGPGPNGERVARLLAVLALPDTDELEVHLVLDGKRAAGRAPAGSDLVGAVEATIDGLRALGAPVAAQPKWARVLGDSIDKRTVVAVALECVALEPPMQYGLAAGTSPVDAAARATLDATSRVRRELRRHSNVARAAVM